MLPVRVSTAPGVAGVAAAASSARGHGGESAGQVDPVVGVADRRVQLGEVVAVGLDHPAADVDPGAEDISVHVAPIEGFAGTSVPTAGQACPPARPTAW